MEVINDKKRKHDLLMEAYTECSFQEELRHKKDIIVSIIEEHAKKDR